MTTARRRARVGIDFDNTLVCYDAVFARAARERDLVPGSCVSKLQIRDLLRRTGREEAWTELQGHVYGARMDEALAFPGALDVLRAARERGDEVFIISHRTRYPARGPSHDLHRAARDWMARHLRPDGRPVVDETHIFLETTREAKIRRIAEVGCDVFVDDLPEVLMAEGLPKATRRILFDPDDIHPSSEGLERARSWAELAVFIAGPA